MDMLIEEAAKILTDVVGRYKGKKPVSEALKTLLSQVKSSARGTRQGSITNAMHELFEEHGVDEVTLEMATAAAITIKPDTSFDKTHLAYHKTQYRKIQTATAVNA